jgi:hypothetical protein
LFDRTRQPRALQRALDWHAGVSEDIDVMDQMLRPYDRDAWVGVAGMGSQGGGSPRIGVKWSDRGAEAWQHTPEHGPEPSGDFWAFRHRRGGRIRLQDRRLPRPEKAFLFATPGNPTPSKRLRAEAHGTVPSRGMRRMLHGHAPAASVNSPYQPRLDNACKARHPVLWTAPSMHSVT